MSRFVEKFKELAKARIAETHQALDALPDPGAVTIVRRQLHTLKGEAGLVGLDRFASVATSAERLVESLENTDTVTLMRRCITAMEYEMSGQVGAEGPEDIQRAVESHLSSLK